MSATTDSCPPLVDPFAWRDLLSRGRRVSLEQGIVLFEDRDEGRAMYAILDGPIEIYKRSTPGTELRLAILDQGDLFGERCLFGDARRSASARAYGPAELIELPVDILQDFLDSHPAFSLQFHRYLCERFSQMINDLDADVRSLHLRLSFT